MVLAGDARERNVLEMQSKGHAVSWGNSSFQAEGSPPHTHSYTPMCAHKRTFPHLNPGKNCSPFYLEKGQEVRVCVSGSVFMLELRI